MRSAIKGVCACTNHYCSDEIKAAETVNIARTSSASRPWTASARWSGRSACGRSQTADDANLGTFTLQSMVFEPATLKLHLAIGEIPASRGAMKTIDLRRCSRGSEEVSRTVPPREAPLIGDGRRFTLRSPDVESYFWPALLSAGFVALVAASGRLLSP